MRQPLACRWENTPLQPLASLFIHQNFGELCVLANAERAQRQWLEAQRGIAGMTTHGRAENQSATRATSGSTIALRVALRRH
jgi:hypothetical protein